MSRQNVATYRIAGLAIYSFLLFGCGGGGTPTTPCNNLLSSLSISGATLAPAFSSGVTNYTATVPSSTNSVEVLPITSTPSCASFILRNRTGFGTIIALVVGDNTISIEVFVRTLPFLSTPIRLYTIVVTRSPFAQEAYIKASNTNAADRFGQSVAVSGDGNTLAVGADGEDSAATGVNGDQADNNAVAAGAVYVFTRDSGGVWTQQAYVKASITDADDGFGHSVALSGDGNTLAVGADGEDSAATGVNGDQADNNAAAAGAVYVFTRDSGGVWTQQAYVKASNTDADDRFGHSVALSGDGNALAVGADGEDSAATRVNGDQADNSASAAGAVYAFTRDSGGVWTQLAYIKATNTDAGDGFGHSVALSGDGNTLAMGADGEDSAATGVDGDRSDNNASAAGAVYVYNRPPPSGGWDAGFLGREYVKASNTDAGDGFGHSVALSGDGITLVVGADDEDSAATGVNGDQTDNNAPGAGAVYFFTRKNFGSVWIQQAYIKASNTDASDGFGHSVALSGDDNRLAVGADGEDSAAIGVNGDQADNNASAAGAVYVSR